MHPIRTTLGLLLLSAVVALGGLLPATGLTVTSAAAAASSASSAADAEHRLDELGCHAGRPDGHLDRHTRSAVMRFQSRQRLAQTGRLDRRTLRLLDSGHALRCDQRPVPRRSGTGRRIVVSQRQNWIWLLGPKGGVVAQAGMVDNPGVLHRGSYAVGSYCGRATRIAHNTDASGTLWLDHFVRFAPCGIGFHRIPRHKSTGRQIHPDWILGTNLSRSHGCLRLSRETAAKVWRFTRRPTHVHVVRG